MKDHDCEEYLDGAGVCVECEGPCPHDDIDGGYCIDCEAPVQDFMDCDYFKDRQDD